MADFSEYPACFAILWRSSDHSLSQRFLQMPVALALIFSQIFPYVCFYIAIIFPYSNITTNIIIIIINFHSKKTYRVVTSGYVWLRVKSNHKSVIFQ